MKRLNFSDNLTFKGKTAAKFLLRSHFFSLYNNMTTNNKLTMIPFKKYVTYIMECFIPFIQKHFRAIYFSVKYDLCFQDRSFDVELLFDSKLLLEVESL